jgi:hypothetical protein
MMGMAEAAQSRPRWYCLTPDRLIVGLLAIEGLLWLSNRLQWPPWHKGYAVLAALGTVGAFLVFMLVWLAAALIFRLRFQFSLRSLLALMLAGSLPCSWLTCELREAIKQKDAADVICKLGGYVAYDYQRGAAWLYVAAKPQFFGPRWLWEWLGEDFFQWVEYVWLRGTRVTDADLPVLREFPRLRVAFVGVSNITDAGLKQIDGMSRLEVLEFGYTKVTDAGIQRLKDQRLDALRLLSAECVPLSDAVVASIASLPHLQALGLGGTKVTDAALPHLARCNELEILELPLTHITDLGLEQIGMMHHLQHLRLEATGVTDVGLEHLGKLTQLRSVSLTGSRVTKAGVRKLQQALPDCKIER